MAKMEQDQTNKAHRKSKEKKKDKKTPSKLHAPPPLCTPI